MHSYPNQFMSACPILNKREDELDLQGGHLLLGTLLWK